MSIKPIEVHKLYSLERNRDYIFIKTIEELQARVDSKTKDPYNLVRISALLRLLFIDGSKFYNIVNSTFKIKLGVRLMCTFQDCHGLSTIFDKNDHIKYMIIIEDKDGDLFSIDKILLLKIIDIKIPTLEEYLNAQNLKMEYDINGMIKLFANAHGGVHIDKMEEKMHNFLFSHSGSPFNLNSNSDFYNVMFNVSSILLKAIAPLTNEVKLKLKTAKPIVQESRFEFKGIGIISTGISLNNAKND